MVMPKVDLWERNGYGRFGKRSLMVHRVVFELFVGPIQDGLEIDHVCHTQDRSCPGGVTCPHRKCANPAHLEAVTRKVNALRGRSFSAVNAIKTHCHRGHLFDEENTYIWPGAPGTSRACKACMRLRSQGIA